MASSLTVFEKKKMLIFSFIGFVSGRGGVAHRETGKFPGGPKDFLPGGPHFPLEF